jgi:hypothetical protein
LVRHAVHARRRSQRPKTISSRPHRDGHPQPGRPGDLNRTGFREGPECDLNSMVIHNERAKPLIRRGSFPQIDRWIEAVMANTNPSLFRPTMPTGTSAYFSLLRRCINLATSTAPQVNASSVQSQRGTA